MLILCQRIFDEIFVYHIQQKTSEKLFLWSCLQIFVLVTVLHVIVYNKNLHRRFTVDHRHLPKQLRGTAALWLDERVWHDLFNFMQVSRKNWEIITTFSVIKKEQEADPEAKVVRRIHKKGCFTPSYDLSVLIQSLDPPLKSLDFRLRLF